MGLLNTKEEMEKRYILVKYQNSKRKEQRSKKNYSVGDSQNTFNITELNYINVKKKGNK